MIMQLNNFFYLILFILGSITFISNRKHLLMTLISLEFIVICLYLYLYVSLNNMEYMYYFSMIFLSFSVCEGSLGLSILVSLIRSHGSDYFQTYSVLQC